MQRRNIEDTGGVASAVFVAYGRRIRVHANDPEMLGLVAKYLPYGSKPSRAQMADRTYLLSRLKRQYVLLRGGERLAESAQLGEIFEALERDARLYVSEHGRRRLFVHAGVVAWKGQAVVIPGASMSGKTSLTAAFVRAGLTYYSDEFAVIDEQGYVHPYAKPLSMRNSDGYSQTDCPVESLGGRTGRQALPVGLVLVTRYGKGSCWRPKKISPGMGAMALLANTVAARNEPERTLDVLRNAMSRASVLKSVRGEASSVVESVLQFGRIRPVSN
jgi:hypothetical protein